MNEKEKRDKEIELELIEKGKITPKRRVKWFIGSFLFIVIFAFIFSSVYNGNISIPSPSFIIPVALITGLLTSIVGPRFGNLMILGIAAYKYKRENKNSID